MAIRFRSPGPRNSRVRSTSQTRWKARLAGPTETAQELKNGGKAQNGAFSLLETEQWGAGVAKVEAALHSLSAAQAADLNVDLRFTQSILAWVAKSVAVDIIGQAEAVAVSKGELKAIEQAKALVTEGDSWLADEMYAAAVDSHQKAIGRVEKLVD